jgi:hypothetical protein
VTWLGIVLAYDSFTWPPSHDGWPVSFFVVALTLAAYVLSQFAGRRRPARRGAAGREPAPAPPGRPHAAKPGPGPVACPPGHRHPGEPGWERAAEFRMEG